ncbi:MAG: hypothetical protein ACI8RD_006690 [Bacillariaceae sp.]|jgi:hypothetical protein
MIKKTRLKKTRTKTRMETRMKTRMMGIEEVLKTRMVMGIALM